MATKSSAKTETKKTNTKSKTSNKNTKQNLLYIMSSQCGWCKKADPVVEELVKEGYKITKLDVINPEEAATANAAKSKHNAQCGTPLFLDEESGNMKCGFAEKDVIEKWANGEEIPAPPQPKSPPPSPPTNFQDESQVNTFKEAYEKWGKENDHLPRILPVDQVLQRMEQAQNMRAQQQAGGPPMGAPGGPPMGAPGGPPMGAPGGSIIQPNAPTAPVVNTGDDVIISNRLQILESKNNILEAKLDQVIKTLQVNNAPTVQPTWNAAQAPSPPVRSKGSQAGGPRGVDPNVKERAKEIAARRTEKNKSTSVKSKTNKKTVPSF